MRRTQCPDAEVGTQKLQILDAYGSHQASLAMVLISNICTIEARCGVVIVFYKPFYACGT